jgi:hypothetical protein
MALSDLVAKYAPTVVLHRHEKLLPGSADWFLERSRLRWATGRNLGGDSVPDAGEQVSAERLGASGENPYRVGKYLATALTRPLDDHAARRGEPPLEQGFFLRLRDEISARGAKSASPDPSLYTGATVYADVDERAKAITYWLFYPGSSPPLGILRAGEQIRVRSRDAAGQPEAEEAPEEVEAALAAASLEEFQRAYPGLALEAEPAVATRGLMDVRQRLRVVAEGVRALLRDDDVLHEGDWERITVYLDESSPEAKPPAAVVFYRHSTNTTRKWAGVEKEETHPVVYCAIGSHASLPSANFGFIDVGDAGGPRWRTWGPGNTLVSIREQPWYGFGGAWGRVGRVRDSTGPLGPGAHWKHAAPRPPS